METENTEAEEPAAAVEDAGLAVPVIIPDDPSEFNFQPFTAIDNDACTVTVKDIDASVSFAINFELENKSSDTNYNFIAESVAINGMNDYGYLYAPVAPGQKTSQPLELGYGLKAWGVGKYTDIEVTMVVQTDMYSEEPVARETFHIYPYGEDKAEKFVRESKDTDQVLIDNDMIKLVLTDKVPLSMIPPEEAAMAVNLFIENKTEDTFRVSPVKVSVNDYMIEGGSPGVMLNGDHCGTVDVYLSGAQFKEYEIEKIEELEFELQLIDPNTYETVDSEIVTITP